MIRLARLMANPIEGVQYRPAEPLVGVDCDEHGAQFFRHARVKPSQKRRFVSPLQQPAMCLDRPDQLARRAIAPRAGTNDVVQRGLLLLRCAPWLQMPRQFFPERSALLSGASVFHPLTDRGPQTGAKGGPRSVSRIQEPAESAILLPRAHQREPCL